MILAQWEVFQTTQSTLEIQIPDTLPSDYFATSIYQLIQTIQSSLDEDSRCLSIQFRVLSDDAAHPVYVGHLLIMEKWNYSRVQGLANDFFQQDINSMYVQQ